MASMMVVSMILIEMMLHRMIHTERNSGKSKRSDIELDMFGPNVLFALFLSVACLLQKDRDNSFLPKSYSTHYQGIFCMEDLVDQNCN